MTAKNKPIRQPMKNCSIIVCKSCGQEKEAARYQKVSGGKFYLRKYCITCWSAEREDYQREYREKNSIKLKAYDAAKYSRNKEKLTSSMKQHYRRLQNDVFAHYGNQCACCGEQERNFLTLDHKNNDGANHRRKIGVGHILFRWIIDNNYPDSIQILCFNCNSGKHINGGICPHDNAYKSQSDFMCYTPYNYRIGI